MYMYMYMYIVCINVADTCKIQSKQFKQKPFLLFLYFIFEGWTVVLFFLNLTFIKHITKSYV